MSSPIVIADYDPEWVGIFEEIRDFVLPAVSDLVIGIEHVGSTSVPGLAAKPIVDIDIAGNYYLHSEELAKHISELFQSK